METASITFTDTIDDDLEAFTKSLGLGDDILTITDIESRIDYLLEKIRDTGFEIAGNNTVANRRHLMIEDWQQGENAKLDRRIDWLHSQIRQLVPADAQEMKDVHGKGSRTLPNGEFGYRQNPDKVEITDMHLAVAYADQNHIAVKAVRTVSKNALKAHARETGALDGTGWEVIPGEEAFFLTVAK